MKGNFSILCRIDLNRLSRIPSSPYDLKHRLMSKKFKETARLSYDNYLDEDLYRSNVSERPSSTQPATNTLELNDVNDKVRPTSSLDRKTIGVPVTDLSKARIKEIEYLKTATTEFPGHSTLNGLTSDRIDELSSKLFTQREVKVKSETENSIGKHSKRKYLDSTNSPKKENRKKKKAIELEVCLKVPDHLMNWHTQVKIYFRIKHKPIMTGWQKLYLFRRKEFTIRTLNRMTNLLRWNRSEYFQEF